MPQYTDAVTPSEVIDAGAGGLASLTDSPAVLVALRSAYVQAIRRTIILGLGGVILATIASCFMEWVNIKQVAQEREHVVKADTMSVEKQDSDTQQAQDEKVC